MSSSPAPNNPKQLGRICPFCGMPGIGESNVCESCGWELESEDAIVAAEATATVNEIREHGDELVAAMLIIPAFMVLVQLLYVARLHAFRLPGLKYLVVMAVTSIGIAALGMLDARRLVAGTKDSPLRYQPAEWYLLLLVLWPVFLPVYLKKRAALGGADYVPIAGVVVGVFALSSLVVASIILHPAAPQALVPMPGKRFTLRTGKQASVGGSVTTRTRPLNYIRRDRNGMSGNIATIHN